MRSILLCFLACLATLVPLHGQTVYLTETFDGGVVPPPGWFQDQGNSFCDGWRPSHDLRAEHADLISVFCEDVLWTTVDLTSATEAYLHVDIEVWRSEYLRNHPQSRGNGTTSLVARRTGSSDWIHLWDECRTDDRRDLVSVGIPPSLLGGQVDVGVRFTGFAAHISKVDLFQVDDEPAPPDWPTTFVTNLPDFPSTTATAPYFQDFEAGLAPPEMALKALSAVTWQPDPDGWCEIANTAGTYQGQYCLEMGTSPGTYALGAGIMTLKVDLSPLSHPVLRFQARNWGDSTQFEDGVYVSNTGAVWYEVFDNWNGLPSEWAEVVVDLSTAPVDRNQPVYVMMFVVSSEPYGLDGVGIDNIVIEEGSPDGCFLLLKSTGDCPGRTTLEIEGATPGGTVHLAYGLPGSYTWTGSPCSGITLDLAQPMLGQSWFPASSILCLPLDLPPAACGWAVQAVDLSSCCVSNVVVF